MKKNLFLTIVVFALILISQPSIAKMTSLSEKELRKETAQAGIMITADKHLDVNMAIKNVSYGDQDGTGPNDTRTFLSLNNVSLKGSFDFDSPVSVSVTTKKDIFDNRVMTGIDVQINKVKVDIDHLTVDSITVGSEPGQGKSFGSFGIYGYKAEISGEVRITTH